MFNGPSNLKFRKYHKLWVRLNFSDGKFFCPKFSDYGLQSRGCGKLLPKHIEAGRRVMRRTLKKSGKLKINIFPYASITKKPVAARMGKGKGKHFRWFCPVKKFRILYEISVGHTNKYEAGIKVAFLRAKYKLPVRVVFKKLIY